MIFENKKISTSSSMAFIISSIREVNKVSSATMSNSQSDLLVLKNLGVSLHPNPSPNFIPVRWLPPPPDWIKVNTDGAVEGLLDLRAAAESSEITEGLSNALLRFL